MEILDNSTLINTYKRAVEIKLSQEFIYLLEKEIKYRGLNF
ncbi:sporulation histidine kinase inhibitor Sda [Alkalibacillus silvisoli]|uniref:Sporulation histidine kinase inhibitor Sda n=1 Tax=Alkalibacillus silvisoli TaxID=392823 RepID=A0ABP3JNY5_9BACI